jgi:hypothetical protein
MKILIFLMISLNSFIVFGEDSIGNQTSHRDGWALGLGFGSESDYDSVNIIEVKSPTLIGFSNSNLAVVLSGEIKEISGSNSAVTPIHLLLDLTYVPYKDIVKSYMRVGGGAVFVDDKALFSESSFFNFQVQFGVELITVWLDTDSYSTFFAQSMINLPGIRSPQLNGTDIFDGTAIILGIRNYF